MGFSILSLIEIFYYFCFRSAGRVSREKINEIINHPEKCLINRNLTDNNFHRIVNSLWNERSKFRGSGDVEKAD